MPRTRRRATVIACLLLIAAAGASPGCSKSVDKAAARPKDEFTLSHTDEAVVIRNTSGRPALNVRATVDGGSAGTFSYILPTMEAGEEKTVLFGLFRSEDGTLLDVAAVSPKGVALTASDALRNTYETTSPW